MDVQPLWQEVGKRRLKEVAKENGLTTQALVAMFDQAGLTGRQPADPSPDEIAAAARVIRAGWTPEVERARWVAATTVSGW